MTKLDQIGRKIRRKSKYFEEITKNMAFRRIVLSDKLENSPLSIKIQYYLVSAIIKQKNVAFRLVLWLDKLKKSPLIIKFQYNIMNAKTFLGSNRGNCADFSPKSAQKQLFSKKTP